MKGHGKILRFDSINDNSCQNVSCAIRFVFNVENNTCAMWGLLGAFVAIRLQAFSVIETDTSRCNCIDTVWLVSYFGC